MLLKPSTFHRLSATLSPEELKAFLEKTAQDSPSELLPVLKEIVPYLTMQGVRELVSKALSYSEPNRFLKFIPEIGKVFPDINFLRGFLIGILAKNPWEFYIYSEQYKYLFEIQYFEDLLAAGTDFLEDPNLRKLFQLYYGNQNINSFPPLIQEKLKKLAEKMERTDLKILCGKEPGFACGGLERNYTEAAKSKTGLCIVNGNLLAKRFHRKGDGKKITMIVNQSMLTAENIILWNDYIYVPANGSHVHIEKALDDGQKEISIPDFSIRPVRPLIDLDAAQIFAGITT